MENESKARVLYLLKILEQYSDDEHPISTVELIKLLQGKYGIKAHRTTISNDISVLVQCGIDIVTINTTQNKYFIGSRLLEIPELKLLIDAVESSKLITEKKSVELVAKLSSLTSKNQAAKLKRNLCIADRIKPGNEQVYYIVDAINNAINSGKKISFQYFEYAVNKQRVLKNNGSSYIFSPYKLVWNGDYYYVVGYSEKHQKISTFRVDRIAKAPVLLPDEAEPIPEDFNIAEFTKSVFQMYDSDHVTVELKCDNSLMKNIMDRFGEDVFTTAYSITEFKATVEVSASPTFYGWLFGFGGKIQILSPESIKESYKELVKNTLETIE